MEYVIRFRRLFALLIWLSSFEAYAQSSNDIYAYIEKYKEIALQQEREFGIPAPITLAQGILESGAGKSGLTRNSNNHFGIKKGKNWNGAVYYAWDDDPTKSPFRVYVSAAESYRDHSRFLRTIPRYRGLFAHSVYDYRGWANGLQKAGYATLPTYAKGLIGIIDAYRLYAINGGVKLRPGKKEVITKTITVEELVDDEDLHMDEDEKSEEEEDVAGIIQRFVVEINDVRCTILYPGETLSSVAMRYDISKRELLEYNETGSEKSLKEGDIVYLEKKRNKFYGSRDEYSVDEGDTMYSVSQKFGIKVNKLCKMNGKGLFAALRPGEVLRLK